MEATGTFKYTKTDLLRQGYDPAATDDVLYFQPPGTQVVPFGFDQALYERIQAGQIRP